MQETVIADNSEQLLGQRDSIIARVGQWLDHEQRLGYLMIIPAVLVLVVLVAYPFIASIQLSFTDTINARDDTGDYVGLQQYEDLLNEDTFTEKVIPNTFLYTVVAVPVKLILGLGLAILLNRVIPLRHVLLGTIFITLMVIVIYQTRATPTPTLESMSGAYLFLAVVVTAFIVTLFIKRDLPMQGIIRGLILLPWVMPIALSIVIFVWMFEPTQSVLNYILSNIGMDRIPWKSTREIALAQVMIVNIWRGAPFFAVVLLAALQGVPEDQLEAAQIDGANVLQRFRNVVIPNIFPVIVVATLFSVVRTFAEMEIVWLLTGGAPFDGTHMIGTYAYQEGIRGSLLAKGAAISLFFFPFLFLIVVFQLWYIQRRDDS